jgi:subtilisin family serine protease
MPVRSGGPRRRRMGAPIHGACVGAVLALMPSAVLSQTRGGFEGGPMPGGGRGGGGLGGAGFGIGIGAGIIGGVIAPMLRAPRPEADDAVEPQRPRRPAPAVARPDEAIPARPRPAHEKAAVHAPSRPVRPPLAEAPRPDSRRTVKAAPAAPPPLSPPRIERAEPARPPQPARKVTSPRPVLPPAAPPSTARGAPPPVPAARPVADEPGLVPGEVLVTLRPSAPRDAASGLARRAGLRLLASEGFTLVPVTLHRYAIRSGRSVASVLRTLEADPQVAAAQPNHAYALVGGVAPALAGAQYAVGKLRLAEAQETATGRGIPVAVIDSGVDAAHPALAGALERSWDAIGKGAVPPGSAHAHGTAVAGLVGARGPLASPAPEARLLAIRAFTGPGEARPSGAQGTTVHVLRAVDWAAQAGARVVNMSFAGPADALLARFLTAGSDRGTVYVAAGGNAGAEAPPLYPAADPSVIAVTATDAEDRLYRQANRGGHLCVAAPGADVLAAAPGGGYGLLSGTSMAAPAVAGIVAMLLQADPALTPARVRDALMRGARDLGPPGPDPEYGAGLADARATLQSIGLPPPAAGTAEATARAVVAAPEPAAAETPPTPRP